MVNLKATSFFEGHKSVTRGILEVTLVSLCPSKNDVVFKITTWSKFNSDQS